MTFPTPTFTDRVDQQFFIAPINGPFHPENYLDRFPDSAYTKAPDSHLVRLVYTLIGPAGTGWLKKNYLDARLILADHGFEVFDLEKFYGNPFRFNRIIAEHYDDDPLGIFPRDVWDKIKAQDESYRSRSIDFFNGARFGTSPEGMHLAARSGVGHEVEIIENYQYLFDVHSDEPKGLPYFGSTTATEEFIVVPHLEVSRAELQTVTIEGVPTGGNFVLALDGRATPTIAYNELATAFQAKLATLPNVGVDNIQVTGGPPDTGGIVFQPYTVRFTGILAGQNVSQLKLISNGLSGGVSPTVTVETARSGFESTDETVTIGPDLQHNLQEALDKLRSVTTLPTVNIGKGLQSRQHWNSIVASSEYNEVLRYVTGSKGIQWPTVDSIHWIEKGIEKEAPRIRNDHQYHYQGFHNVESVIAYNNEAFDDPRYSAGVPSTFNSEHIGRFSSAQSQLFPFLGLLQDDSTIYTADRVLADYPEPLTVTSQTSDVTTVGSSLINGIYPADYNALDGVPPLKYQDDQFWASRERSIGGEVLEIDLGSPQAVNFVTFEITRKPLDIEISFDTLDFAPVRRFVSVTPNTNAGFETAIFFENDTTNPWEYLEFNFADGLGRTPFTRVLRIQFTRRLTLASDGSGFLYDQSTATQNPFSIDVRNLRIGRNAV